MSSVLNVDTIANKAGSGPVGLTKQEAMKVWVNYDATAQAVDGSLNNSSVTDSGTGDFTFTQTNAFSAAADKCCTFGCWNTINTGSGQVTSTTRGANGGHLQGDQALATGTMKVDYLIGSDGSNNAAMKDFSACFAQAIGDLA